ncbi:MAG: TonB family protein, partial [Spirulina sp.]
EALELNPPAPPSPERSLSPQQLAARQRDQATTNRIARLREDYRARDTNTTPEEAEKNQERWLAETNQPQARERLRAIAMQGAYPKEACINRARGTAIYGVVVQPNGRKTDVQQIRSTGYRLLDRQAIAQISGAGLAVGAQPVPYRVTVRFTYDASICPTLATPARPTRSPSPQPSAGASPSPSPTTPEPAVPPNEPLQKKPKTIAPHDE